MAEQLRRRRPATRDQQRVRGDLADRAVAVDRRDAHPLDTLLAERLDHRVTADDVDLVQRGGGRRSLGPRIDHRGDLDARSGQSGGGGVGRVVGREDDGAPAGRHGPAAHVRARGRGEHDARQVVAGERDRALVGARREHDAAGAHVPQPLAGGASLRDDRIALVVQAGGGRAAQDPDLGARGQASLDARDPVQRRQPVDDRLGGTGVQQPAPQARPAGHEDHPRAAGRGRVGGGERRRPGADHQHVAVRVGMVVADAVAERRGIQTPATAERLRLQAVGQLDLRRGEHRLAHAVTNDLGERRRLAAAGGQRSARAGTVQARRPAHDPAGQRRGGQRVAGQPFARHPVELEAQRAPAVEQRAPRGQAMAHAGTSNVSPSR